MKSPDERDAMAVVWAALGLALGMCLCGLTEGCGANTPSPQQQVIEGQWTFLDAKCLALPTKAEADRCADVNREAACGPGGALAEAGVACERVRLSDGGIP